jgi:hypothetical protein
MTEAGKARRLPGWRAGHVQSNSNNSVIVADSYLPQRESNWDKKYWNEGARFMSLNYPEGDRPGGTAVLSRHLLADAGVSPPRHLLAG